ncbi:MAG: hypothetical protein CMP50_03670 [Flavobacteriales bacterium]|nr:hypothetical protein [Flavobacteriales bacterium]|tara:strand:+ start:5630 stop:6442 length:813 start_codon:yes stop_codon:yes gene_type:complete
MKIIIDNGGTKLDWGIFGDSTFQSFNNLNLLQTETSVIKDLHCIFPREILFKKNIEIDFYTAGFNQAVKLKITKVLFNYFNKPTVNVFSDILAASRALYKKDKGIVCILGTGSNCAFFDGNKNHFYSSSLGHLLGDEGSGYDLGKKLLKAYFRNDLPETLKTKFDIEINMNQDQFLHSIYSVANKKYYIASFAKFLKKHDYHPYIKEIIRKSITNYFIKHPFLIENYHTFKFGFVGSVAFYFREYIDDILRLNKIEYKIIDKPIKKLLCN